jgi:hypothetical protein
MPIDMYAGGTVSSLLISKTTAINSEKINHSRFPFIIISANKEGIRFRLPKSIQYRLSIVSVNGRKVFSISEFGLAGLQYKSFGTKPISNGLYYIYFNTKDKRTVKKMIIVK